MASYTIKISGEPRVSGEYEGGKTLAAARKEARTFLPHVSLRATVRIVRFRFAKGDPEDGACLTVETIQEGVCSWLGGLS